MQSPTLALLVDAVVGTAVIAAAVVLLCLGHIDSQTGIALIAGGAALASGSSKAVLALKVPAPGQAVPYMTITSGTSANTATAAPPPVQLAPPPPPQAPPAQA